MEPQNLEQVRSHLNANVLKAIQTLMPSDGSQSPGQVQIGNLYMYYASAHGEAFKTDPVRAAIQDTLKDHVEVSALSIFSAATDLVTQHVVFIVNVIMHAIEHPNPKMIPKALVFEVSQSKPPAVSITMVWACPPAP